MKTPLDIVNAMMEKDAFSQWLGIEIESVEKGSCHLNMKVTYDMLNGFGISHGGITYSLADSALAFAANTHGRQCKSIETSISHLQKVEEGDILTAVTSEIKRGYKIGIYEVLIHNQDKQKVALFKGTVYISEKIWA